METLLSRPVNTSFSPEGVRTVDFQADTGFINKVKSEWQAYAEQIPAYPGGFEGKGIVICAGGLRYFTCAWININLLRKYGCLLPIEVWYTGSELTDEIIAALSNLNVVCKNADNYSSMDLRGYILKPFAILHSEFKEVLYLDADNNPTADPAYLFDSPAYAKYGCVFWPDFWTTDPGNPIWEIVESDKFSSMEQESGQILVNKEKCWKELQLCLYFNMQRDVYYKMLMGDKDTFKFAWLALQSDYFMIDTPVGSCGYTSEVHASFFGLSMVQHDFDGNIIFVHRNLLKWDLTQEGERIWREIKRFRQGVINKEIITRYIHLGNGQPFLVADISGEVEAVSFDDILGDFELTCLNILAELRNTDFYSRFLLHTYFLFFKPGYAQNQ